MYLLSQKTNRIIIGLLILTGICRADMIINPIDRGTYRETGTHEQLNVAYGMGHAGSGFILNNFFVFDVSSLSETVSSAEINIFSSFYLSSDPFETYTLYDVTTDINAIRDASAGVTAFNDFQNGNSYGNYNISSSDNGIAISITLNGQAIQDINNSAGGLFAIGGTVATMDIPRGTQEEIFGFTSTSDPTDGVELVLTMIPEPSVLGLLIIGCGMLALRRRRIR